MTDYVVPLLIGGETITTKTTFDVVSPKTSKTIWRCSLASRSDAQAAVAAADGAFRSWSSAKPAFRRDILLRAADIFTERAEEFADYMMQETGAESSFAAGFNLPLTVEMLRDVAGRVSSIMGHIPACAHDGTNALILKEPYGVILGIAPWNAPYVLGLRSIIYALAAGNTCVLKGSELSPRCFWAIGTALKDAGLPDGCLSVIYHRPEDAAEITTTLIENPAVKKVNFTGSTMVGSIIAATAGKNLKPVLMELGGKASAIVLDDADVQKAANQCALGAFLNSGQICMSTERILVQRSISSTFIPALRAAIAETYPPTKPAPILVAATGVKRNKTLITSAVASGAEILYGDIDIDVAGPEQHAGPNALRPVVVGGVTPAMDIYHTESFGPSVSVIEFDTDDDALRIANDTDYGLSAAVFTADLGRGLRVAKRIDAGAVHINSMSVHDEAALPHGGVKKSGWGRFNGAWGLDEFLVTKTITFQD